jgi:hypothetical protein
MTHTVQDWRVDLIEAHPGHERANCSSVEVQLAIGIDELPDDAPLVETMRRLAEEDRNED